PCFPGKRTAPKRVGSLDASKNEPDPFNPVSVEEARRMVHACEDAGVKLAVGYRLHFNRHHRQVMQWGRERTHGRVRYVNAVFTTNVGEPGQWRLRRALSGGGSLMDLGIYCVQAARHATGEEPVAVTAQFA